jgi:hypothetical protein
MMSSEFICLFWLRYESYACGGFLNLLIHFMPILALGYLLVILWRSVYVDSLLFCKYWHNSVHNCLNTCLYALWSILILNLMHSISFFSCVVFDEFIVKGGECGHKVDRTLSYRVDERRNMINNYLRGRDCIKSVRGSVNFELLLWFWVFLLFSWFCRFSCLLLAFTVFLLLDNLLELFLAF